jgi:hypothetical protein
MLGASAARDLSGHNVGALINDPAGGGIAVE